MRWELKIDKGVIKNLHRFPSKDAQRMWKIIEGLIIDPFSGDIKHMEGDEGVWRRRVGNYRLFY